MNKRIVLDLDDDEEAAWQAQFRAVYRPAREADFNPEDHPRDKDGRFAFADGSSVLVVPTDSSPDYTKKRRGKVGIVLWSSGSNVKVKIGKQSFTFGRDELQPHNAQEADFEPDEHPRDENGKFTFKGTPGQKTRDEMTPNERMDEDLRKKADPKRGRWDEGSGGALADPDHKPIRSGGAGYWGASHAASSAITGASASAMGIPGYRTDIALEHKGETADRFLRGIYESPGSHEALYHGFENREKIDWKVGDTLALPLLASSGDRDHSLGYGIRSDAENQRGEPTVFEFPRGTPMAGYSKWNKEDTGEFGQVWSEAIVAGKFRVVALGSDTSMGWQSDRSKTVWPEGSGHPKIKVVRLEPTEKFNPDTKEWVKV